MNDVIIPETTKTFSNFRDSYEENNYIAKLGSIIFLIDTQLQTLYKHPSFDIGKQSKTSGNNSVVECNLAKVEVASSNLVSRSTIKFKRFDSVRTFFY